MLSKLHFSGDSKQRVVLPMMHLAIAVSSPASDVKLKWQKASMRGVNVVITILIHFSAKKLAKKLAIFLKTNVMSTILSGFDPFFCEKIGAFLANQCYPNLHAQACISIHNWL
jgi:hypothetical protein